MAQGVVGLTHLALALERFAGSATPSLPPPSPPLPLHTPNTARPSLSPPIRGHKRPRDTADASDATWYRQLSPAQHVALKKTAAGLFWPHPVSLETGSGEKDDTGNAQASSIRMLRDLADMLPRRPDAQYPIVDEASRTVHLDACASFQDMAQLAITILLTAQEQAKAREDALNDVARDHVWELGVEKEKTDRACQDLLKAHKEIHELKTKYASLEKELGKVRAALGESRQINQDHAFHVNHLRQNTRSVARHHAELICQHMHNVFNKERAYLISETQTRWAKYYKIDGQALDGLLELYRRVFTRLQVSYDASMDTAAIPLAMHGGLASSSSSDSPSINGSNGHRSMLRASAPAAQPVYTRQGVLNSPTYAPATYIPGHADHNTDINAFLNEK